MVILDEKVILTLFHGDKPELSNKIAELLQVGETLGVCHLSYLRALALGKKASRKELDLLVELIAEFIKKIQHNTRDLNLSRQTTGACALQLAADLLVLKPNKCRKKKLCGLLFERGLRLR